MISHTRELSPRLVSEKSKKDEFKRTGDARLGIQKKTNKQHHIVPNRKDIRTVNMTSSHIKTSPPGVFLLVRVTRDHNP